ncbi:MAG TPA: hypothetical protein VK968_16290 [Roseimicrobium sp.]|nr:hypothetical protein [Roseimicrobium sp.]
MPEPHFRIVIREPEFEEQLAALLVNAEEADDFTLGAEFVLARNPQSGMPANADGSVWYLPMCLVRGRQVSLFYTFDEQTVTFLFIVALDEAGG